MDSRIKSAAVALILAFVVIFSQSSFAGFCGPLNPDTAEINYQICAMQTTRANCGGDCTWYRDDGYPAPYCATLDPNNTLDAPICNLYKTRETCNNNRMLCRWSR
jgi:hypothetical protein